MGRLLLLRYHNLFNFLWACRFMKWFVNYQNKDVVSASDRGLAYGDGVFETIKADALGFYQLNSHLERLQRGLVKLSMPLSVEEKQFLWAFLFDKILLEIDELSVVKVIVTRGEGGRGYAPENRTNHTVLIGVGAAPDYYQHQVNGVHLGISSIPVTSHSYLSGIKHLNRLENVLAKQRLSKGCFEDLMLDTQGHIIECIQSNVFCFTQGKLLTPLLSMAGVSGTYRKHIIENQMRYSVDVGDITLKHLQNSDEIFITNSLMGIVPVISLAGHDFPIGEHTRTLQILMRDKDGHDAFKMAF